MSCSNCCDSRDITLPDGSDGIGISSITLNGSNQFVITYSDNTSTTTSAVTINATGTNILNNNTTAVSQVLTDAAGDTAIAGMTYTLPANTVTTDGSEIRASAWFSFTLPAGYVNNVYTKIYCNGAWFSANSPNGGWISNTGVGVYSVKLDFVLTRKSNTTVAASFNSYGYTKIEGSSIPDYSFGDYEITPPASGIFDFTASTIVFGVYAAYNSVDMTTWSAGGNTLTVTCDKFIVEHYKK